MKLVSDRTIRSGTLHVCQPYANRQVSYSFQQLYGAFLDVVSDLSAAEKQRLFSDTAIAVYRLPQEVH
jgi:hypothetical protein